MQPYNYEPKPKGHMGGVSTPSHRMSCTAYTHTVIAHYQTTMPTLAAGGLTCVRRRSLKCVSFKMTE